MGELGNKSSDAGVIGAVGNPGTVMVGYDGYTVYDPFHQVPTGNPDLQNRPQEVSNEELRRLAQEQSADGVRARRELENRADFASDMNTWNRDLVDNATDYEGTPYFDTIPAPYLETMAATSANTPAAVRAREVLQARGR